MDDLYQKIKSNRSGLPWLMGVLPGFRGYMEMNSRRQADRMMREHIVGQFKQTLNRYTSLEAQLVRAGGLAHMANAKSVKTKFQTLVDRIATDSPGYSGFWSANKIGPDELEMIYAFDEAMLRYNDQIATLVDDFGNAINSKEGIAEALTVLDTVMMEANNAYGLRDDLVKGIV
jgi:hypothetical protein